MRTRLHKTGFHISEGKPPPPQLFTHHHTIEELFSLKPSLKTSHWQTPECSGCWESKMSPETQSPATLMNKKMSLMTDKKSNQHIVFRGWEDVLWSPGCKVDNKWGKLHIQTSFSTLQDGNHLGNTPDEVKGIEILDEGRFWASWNPLVCGLRLDTFRPPESCFLDLDSFFLSLWFMYVLCIYYLCGRSTLLKDFLSQGDSRYWLGC